MVLNSNLYNKNVLVIGDSFTDVSGETTWLYLLAAKYNWNIKNLSIGGSGGHYAWYTFLKSTYSFDICIFCWSEPTRLFHKTIPALNSHEATVEATRTSVHQKPTYAAARQYYRHLVDPELEDLKYVAMLFWLDDYLGKNYSDKIFLHFYAFPKPPPNGDVYTIDYCKLSNIYHVFKNGITISPSLLTFSLLDSIKLADYSKDIREGHLSPYLHSVLFDKLIAYFKTHDYKSSTGSILNIMDKGNINE